MSNIRLQLTTTTLQEIDVDYFDIISYIKSKGYTTVWIKENNEVKEYLLTLPIEEFETLMNELKKI